MKGRASQSGQALVEVAIFGFLLMLLTLGAVDFGTFAYNGIVLGNGAHAGVQYGAQGIDQASDTPGIIAAANNDTQTLAGANTPTVTQYCQCAGATVSCVVNPLPTTCTSSTQRLVYVKVTTSGTFSPVVSFPGIPTTLTITRDAVEQVSP